MLLSARQEPIKYSHVALATHIHTKSNHRYNTLELIYIIVHVIMHVDARNLSSRGSPHSKVQTPTASGNRKHRGDKLRMCNVWFMYARQSLHRHG